MKWCRKPNRQMDDKLPYRKRLRQAAEKYQKNVPPHVKAAGVTYLKQRVNPPNTTKKVGLSTYKRQMDQNL